MMWMWQKKKFTAKSRFYEMDQSRETAEKEAVISDTFSFMGNVLKSYAYRVRWLAIRFVFASNILNAFPKTK